MSAAALVALFDFAALAVFLVAGVVAWYVWRTRLTIEGGGYRPIRTIDLIEFAAADQLDAYDAEQAAAESRRQAEANRTAPRW